MLIAHTADLQIRNFKRHQEYLYAFENLYNSLKEKKPDYIVIPGDIAHTKTQISPEFVDICADFFYELSSLCRSVHITLGNHDGNLNNLSRLDSITPIVKKLRRDNIKLYKQSGVYNVDNLFYFIVFSCFDDKTKWPKYSYLTDEQKLSTNIVL